MLKNAKKCSKAPKKGLEKQIKKNICVDKTKNGAIIEP